MVWTALKAFPCLVDFLAFDATLLLHHAPVPRRGASVNGLRALGAPSGHSLLARCSVFVFVPEVQVPVLCGTSLTLPFLGTCNLQFLWPGAIQQNGQ